MSTVTIIAVIAVAAVSIGLRTTPRRERRSLASPARARSPVALRRRRDALRGRRRRERSARDAVPDLIDLVLIGVQAGETPIAALMACRAAMPASLGPAVDDVLRRTAAGASGADALLALVDQLGTPALALVDALRSSARTGVALGPALDRLADDARDQRRRLAEASARELPVRLAFPLACCTLPAFVFVAIVPLLVATLASLQRL